MELVFNGDQFHLEDEKVLEMMVVMVARQWGCT